MLILALDTALGACSAALLDGDAGRAIAVRSEAMDRGHAERLLPLVDELMREAGLSLRSVQRVVTTVGPGSFTGLRVGISAARGLALAIGCTNVGVTTLEALAAPHLEPKSDATVAAVVDARHGQVYGALYRGDGAVMMAPCQIGIADFAKIAAREPVHIVGPGAQQVAAAFPADGLASLTVDERAAADIVWVARLGRTASAPATPLYLREPDAKPPTGIISLRSTP